MMSFSPEIRSCLEQSAAAEGSGKAYLRRWEREIGEIPGELRRMPYPYRNGIFRLDPQKEADFSGMDEVDQAYGLRRERFFLLPEERLLTAFLTDFLSSDRGREQTGSILPVLSRQEARNTLCPDRLNGCERLIATLLFMGDREKLPLLWREKRTEIRRSYAGRLRRKEGCAPYCALAAVLRESGQVYPDGYPFWLPAEEEG